MNAKKIMVLANCNKRMSVHFTVQGQDESDVIVTALEQTLKTVVPRVEEMSEEQSSEHLLVLNNITIEYSSSTLNVHVCAVELWTRRHFKFLEYKLIYTQLLTQAIESANKQLLLFAFSWQHWDGTTRFRDARSYRIQPWGNLTDREMLVAKMSKC